MLKLRTCLMALSVRTLQTTQASVCPCACGRGSVDALRSPGSMLRPAAGQLTYSQYRHMSLLYYMRTIPKRFKEFKKFQLNIVERPNEASKFPPEIATYLWLISMKAKVHFTNGKWYTSEVRGMREKRPVRELMKYHIDAIDAKGTLIDYHGMAQIIKLKKLKFLSFEGCPYIDDSCLGRLVHLQDSLTHLNINKCPQVTECGLVSLHHLSNLERMNMSDLPGVPHARVMACMLEDVLPNLRIGLVTDALEGYASRRDKWRSTPNPDSCENETKEQVEKTS
ncbi:distal membrane-arm assembly complex protein 2-like [Patiria miniata]|uniref:Mitochondrial ATP synthase regulatory component factor B n=1 Tax=Patiria miniata TaxID=46514 RepID=A0A914B8P8_PATMI|nr:distal membrane-arm assembly complex protein 2-like [Patiria miniata]XP_038072205.1 distal membrane-arm assembly complex protein 2-like [Patiria miniata]XP_038072206.1 distal membrane-arm assembly complex protein 2-like [Patiria miniata]XP_038072207.1 distal membrane-arm assembly complex protein 2-like [Patiria miniata]